MLCAVFFVVLTCGCGKDQNPKSATDHKIVFSEQRVNNRFDNSELKKQVFDMNKDGVVDLWKYYAYKTSTDSEDTELVIIRKELDLNFDGRVDRIMYYNHKENLIREDIDTNFNGRIDRIHHYDNMNLVRTEFYRAKCNKMEIDGTHNPTVNPDMLRFYRQGVMTREELDEKCDGNHESVIIYNPNGEIAQIGKDANNDGIVETWIRY